MNLLAIILLPEECVQDLSISGLFHRVQLKIKIIQRLSLQCQYWRLEVPIIQYLGGNVTSNSALYAMKTLAQNVQGMQVPNSGHWVPEERPAIIIKLLDNFFGGNTTKTIKTIA
jgi:pimeloyl-ACP methyl ester carboxylesterase